MAEAEAAVLHLVDGVAIRIDGGASRAGVQGSAVLVMRAARSLLDRLERADRAAIGAVVVNRPELDGRELRAMAELACGGLPLAGALPLPVAGAQGDGLFIALHVARAALLGGAQTALLLSVCGETLGAFLLGWRGAVACRPLPACGSPDEGPSARRRPQSRERALARMLALGGLRRRDLTRAVSPGVGEVEAEAAGLLRAEGSPFLDASEDGRALAGATTVEEVLALAALQAPPGRTLVRGCGPNGGVSGCLLEGG